jgi:radical SAM superfamily enzyme YgiQ (UPF0313 family)
MTGNPITNSLKISKYIKLKFNTPIVWGGAHPTILPEQTLENEYIDFAIRDWGSKALLQLIKYIKEEPIKIKNILGLGYKEDGKIILNPVQCSFEMLDYQDLPYHLVDISRENYNRLNSGEVIFPIFTAMGCPYRCAFCMAPAVYKKIKGPKWVSYSNDYILDHIDYLLGRYDFQRLQIYDDDSFVDLNKMHTLLSEYIKRGFQKRLKLDFRGARINELDKMDDDYLKLMVKANVELLAIGAESGSEISLKKMNKGITVEQTIRVNKKLARFPSLKPHYNFLCGIPGETIEDLIQTKELLIRLINDHPGCYLGAGADWKPIPGSAMTKDAVKNYGLRLPSDLIGWAAIDSFDAEKLRYPWYTNEINNYIKLLQISGQLLDRKIENELNSLNRGIKKIAFFFAKLYRPLLRLRLKFNFSRFLFEYHIRNFLLKSIKKN